MDLSLLWWLLFGSFGSVTVRDKLIHQSIVVVGHVVKDGMVVWWYEQCGCCVVCSVDGCRCGVTIWYHREQCEKQQQCEHQSVHHPFRSHSKSALLGSFSFPLYRWCGEHHTIPTIVLGVGRSLLALFTTTTTFCRASIASHLFVTFAPRASLPSPPQQFTHHHHHHCSLIKKSGTIPYPTEHVGGEEDHFLSLIYCDKHVFRRGIIVIIVVIRVIIPRRNCRLGPGSSRHGGPSAHHVNRASRPRRPSLLGTRHVG